MGKQTGVLIKFFLILTISLFLFSCGNGGDSNDSAPTGDDLADKKSDFVSAKLGDGNVYGPPVAADSGESSTDDAGDVKREIEEADIIEIDGSNLYILNQFRGLTVCDISDPDHPRITGRNGISGNPMEMYIRNGFAYVIVSVIQEPYYGIPEGGGTGLPASYQSKSRVEVMDIRNPSQPKTVDILEVSGSVTDSRIVGDILYVVSSEEQIFWMFTNDAATMAISESYTSADTNERNVYVASIDLSNPETIMQKDRIDFGGSARYIHVSENAVFIASDPSDYSYDHMDITYVDISDPSGSIRKRGSFQVTGRVEDEFKMDYYDGYFRVCTYQWEDSGISRLFVYDVSDPDHPEKKGSVELGKGEQLFATRFDGNRAYMVTYEQKDPLWVIDLSDPERPAIRGELIVPGWSTHIEPMGDHLLALGIDDTSGWQVSVSLFDVSDPDNPSLSDRVSFGEADGWSSSNAFQDVKSFTILEDLNLILLPYSTSSYQNGVYKSENRLQFIDYFPNDLRGRGSVTQKGSILRGRNVSDRFFSVSSEELQVIDASDRDNPKVTAGVTLSSNVVDFVALENGYGVRVVESGGEYALESVLPSDPDNPVGQIPSGESNFLTLFVNGNLVYVISNQYGSGLYMTDADSYPAAYTTRVTVFDFANPGLPAKRGNMDLDGTYSYPAPLAASTIISPWYGDGEIVQVRKDLLAFVQIEPCCFPEYEEPFPGDDSGAPEANVVTNSETDEGSGASHEPVNKVFFVDLSNPDQPVVAAEHKVSAVYPRVFFARENILFYSYSEEAEPDDKERPLEKFYLGRIDITDPAHPEDLAAINIPGYCVGMDEAGTYIFTMDQQWDDGNSLKNTFNSLRIEGDAAYLMDELSLTESGQRVLIADGFAYLGGYSWWCCGTTGSLSIIDLTDPANLHLHENDLGVGSVNMLGAKGRTLVTTVAGGVGIYDVSDPKDPVLVDYHYGYAWNGRVFFSGGKAYVPMGFYGLFITDI